MAIKLNWFQARALAGNGAMIRREAWRYWLTKNQARALWFIYQPAGEVELVEGAASPLPERLALVLAEEFGRREFLATDWTDEPWNVPATPPTTTTEPPTADPCPPGFHYDAILRRCVLTTSAPPGGSTGGGGTTTPTTGGEDPPTTRPPGGNYGGTSSDSGGAGNFGPGAGPGGGAGGGGGGTGADSTGAKPPAPLPPKPSHTPIVSINLLEWPAVDGPACFITPPKSMRAVVSVSVPLAGASPVTIGFINCTCLGVTKTGGAMSPGGTVGFEFFGPFVPGAKVTATATFWASGAGNSWTGASAPSPTPPLCLLPVLTWQGSQTINHDCNEPGSGIDHGWSEVSTYNVSGQYAVNPTPGAQTAMLLPTPIIGNAPGNWNLSALYTEYPSGTSTNTKSRVAPPGSVTGTMGDTGSFSGIAPATLGALYIGTAAPVVSGICTETKTGSASGPG